MQSDAAHGAVRVGWLSAWQERNYRLYAGGVLLAHANMGELGLGATSANAAYGTVKNVRPARRLPHRPSPPSAQRAAGIDAGLRGGVETRS